MGRRAAVAPAGAGGTAEKLQQDALRNKPRSEWTLELALLVLDEAEKKLQAAEAEIVRLESLNAGAAAGVAVCRKRRRQGSSAASTKSESLQIE